MYQQDGLDVVSGETVVFLLREQDIYEVAGVLLLVVDVMTRYYRRRLGGGVLVDDLVE